MTFAGPVVEVAEAAMDTVFALQVADRTGRTPAEVLQSHARDALAVVHDVERTCSRFEATSELTRLCARSREMVPASPLLLELVALALAVAEASDGAFDPTVGRAMVRHGFDRDWRTATAIDAAPPSASRASWRDVHVDRAAATIRLAQPLTLDLGALAKGFAVDLILAALPPDWSCSLHAGGDVRCRGPHPEGRAWRVGIRDPFDPDQLTIVAQFAEGAVCTSGSYERVSASGAHHLLDPRTDEPAVGFRSVSVVAPTAVVADALATAAFVLGPAHAAAWLEAQGVDAWLIDNEGTRTCISGLGTTTWDDVR